MATIPEAIVGGALPGSAGLAEIVGELFAIAENLSRAAASNMASPRYARLIAETLFTSSVAGGRTAQPDATAQSTEISPRILRVDELR